MEATDAGKGLQLGTDTNAQLLRDSLSELGADLTHVREVQGPTGSAVILLQPSGERAWASATSHCRHLAALQWGMVKLMRPVGVQARTASWWWAAPTKQTGI